MDGQSKREIDLMFAEEDHDAMEWIEKRKLKKRKLEERRIAARKGNQEEN